VRFKDEIVDLKKISNINKNYDKLHELYYIELLTVSSEQICLSFNYQKERDDAFEKIIDEWSREETILLI
jgi:hypothetical protein